MPSAMPRPIHATIHLEALKHNLAVLRARAQDARVWAVVKANAYGCGIEPAVEALSAAGCKTFFVALPEEGMRVKKTAPASRCFVLNGLFEEAAPYYRDAGLTPILGSVPELQVWARHARLMGTPLPCAIHMDSGMNRLGMEPAEWAALRDVAPPLATPDRPALAAFPSLRPDCAPGCGIPGP